ncbi:hypothetical protein [Dickeya dadantii]|uniref:hypothetical protein n=1 Tax=Dickeya dadantii TaxID=204038 RepID=UPI0008FBFAFF|nr:hypothetical protein [Dickeya dadantii]NPE57184.1 hypothetical protein [Dickeya dadantii]NPE69205.1 hypothetical protein [Dickeya dadantii]
MTRDELITQLSLLGVNENSYSLDGLRNSDCTCIVQRDEQWDVCYVERDSPYTIATLSSKEEAYQFVFEQFKKWLS